MIINKLRELQRMLNGERFQNNIDIEDIEPVNELLNDCISSAEQTDVKEMVLAMIRASKAGRPYVITPEEIKRIAKLHGVDVEVE